MGSGAAAEAAAGPRRCFGDWERGGEPVFTGARVPHCPLTDSRLWSFGPREGVIPPPPRSRGSVVSPALRWRKRKLREVTWHLPLVVSPVGTKALLNPRTPLGSVCAAVGRLPVQGGPDLPAEVGGVAPVVAGSIMTLTSRRQTASQRGGLKSSPGCGVRLGGPGIKGSENLEGHLWLVRAT